MSQHQQIEFLPVKPLLFCKSVKQLQNIRVLLVPTSSPLKINYLLAILVINQRRARISEAATFPLLPAPAEHLPLPIVVGGRLAHRQGGDGERYLLQGWCWDSPCAPGVVAGTGTVEKPPTWDNRSGSHHTTLSQSFLPVRVTFCPRIS